MSEETFTNLSLVICLTILMALMGFIIWDLGKKSKAGRFGMLMLFLVLGLGVFGFVIKNVVIEFLSMR